MIKKKKSDNHSSKISEIFQTFLVIYPDCTPKYIWDLVILGSLIFFGFTIPFEIAFLNNSSSFADILTKISLGIFSLDILLTLNTGIYMSGELILKRSIIIKTYLKFWFWIDLLSIIPFNLIIPCYASDLPHSRANKPNDFCLSNLSKLLRLLRLSHIPVIFIKIEDRMESKKVLLSLKIIKIILYLLIVANGAACLMFVVSSQNYTPNSFLNIIQNSCDDCSSSPSKCYIYSLYWAFTTMFTIGYGEISPRSTSERLTGIFIMNLSSLTFGYLYGNLGTLLSKHTAKDKDRRELVVGINRIIKLHNLSDEIRAKSIKYVNYLYAKSNNGVDMDQILGILSQPLREEIFSFINGSLVMSFRFFKINCMAQQGRISRVLRPQINSPCDYIFHEGDISTGMYFITKGCVEIIDKKTGSVIKILSSGEYFGEIGMILDKPRCSSVYSQHFLETLFYNKTDLDILCGQLPSIMHKINKIKQDAIKNDLSEIFVECFLCKTIGHIAKHCSKMTEKELNQRKWLSSRKESQVIREDEIKRLRYPRSEKNVSIKNLRTRNVWGRKRKISELYEGRFWMKETVRDYSNQFYLSPNSIFTPRLSLFSNDFEVSMYMPSIKNYEMVLKSDSEESVNNDYNKLRLPSFDTTLIEPQTFPKQDM